MTAEHGDGLASSGFVEMQYRRQNYSAFGEAESYFGPYGMLNPNKKTTGGSTTV